jgi:probable phosphoglycerate mutase
MKICLIRHAETAWSLSGQHTGKTDLKLTENGEAQARGLAKRLRDFDFTQVLVSPSLRARQTCALAGLGAARQIENDLAEWNYGNYEGLRSVEIRHTAPQWNIWRDGCPGGESPASVRARADQLIERLGAMQGTVALFTHGQFGTALAVRWIGLALIESQHFSLGTASLSVLGSVPELPDRNTIDLWNERQITPQPQPQPQPQPTLPPSH